MDMGKLISTQEAAERVGITQVRIQQLIQRGRLTATRVGRSWVIDEADLKMLKGRKVGRPKQKQAARRTAPKAKAALEVQLPLNFKGLPHRPDEK